MSTFVLVHGAWHGGWCWGRVRPLLQERGHDVFAPTLTGLSDRSHLLSPSVGLGTHVEDIVRLIEAENLYDVILVGHSYAGLVISSVASRIPHRVARRVHLDAFVPRNGEAAIDLLPETIAHHYRESVEGPGFGWLIPPRSLEVLGVTAAEDLGWLTPRLTPHLHRSRQPRCRRSGRAGHVYRGDELDASVRALCATGARPWMGCPRDRHRSRGDGHSAARACDDARSHRRVDVDVTSNACSTGRRSAAYVIWPSGCAPLRSGRSSQTYLA